MTIIGADNYQNYYQTKFGLGTQKNDNSMNSLAYPSVLGSLFEIQEPSASSYGSYGSDSLFSSFLGGGTDMFGDATTSESGVLDIEAIKKAIDTNGNGEIEQNEMEAFLADPTAVLEKAGMDDTENSTQSILSLLKQLFTGQKETKEIANSALKGSQANSSSISQLQKDLQAATAKSNDLQNQVTAQTAKVDAATKTANQAAEDAKAAIAKSNESAKELTNYKNSHGDEDPKLFAKEFGQLLDENKNNAISREEFTKIYEAAGEDLKLNKTEWDSLVDASKLADANKADLKAQVAEADEIDAKGLEEQLFENDIDGDGQVEAGAEINSFATDVAGNDSNAEAVNTGDLAAESFEITPE